MFSWDFLPIPNSGANQNARHESFKSWQQGARMNALHAVTMKALSLMNDE
jgi:hypothetical protein